MMSIWTWRKRPSGAVICPGDRRLCRETFDCWHSGHALHQSEMPRSIDGQTYLLRITWSVTLALGCASLWNRWKIRSRKDNGIMGRSVSPVRSQ